MDEDRGFDSVRLGRLERDRLLNSLEQHKHRAPIQQKRQFDRHTFRQTDVPITIESYGGSIMKFRVCARNISRGGLGFIHGGFLHPGNPCDVVLTTLDGEKQIISGHIAQCRFITGRLHEVGVKFCYPIDLRFFCPGMEDEPDDSAPDAGNKRAG